MNPHLSGSFLNALLDLTQKEDLSNIGDITTELFVSPAEKVSASVSSRQSGVFAGQALVPVLLEFYRSTLDVRFQKKDGDYFSASDSLITISGSRTELLRLERPLLNFLSRLSGIATLTSEYVKAISGTASKIYDTRKTTPGLRHLEKYAVQCGGGHSHRMGLYDAVLVKDNHLAGVAENRLKDFLIEKLASARRRFKPTFIEVEVDSLAQLHAVLECPPGLIDIVLLDNFSITDIQKAVQTRNSVNKTIHLEASGGVTLESVRTIAETGIERISVGALTHSPKHIDIGLDLGTEFV